MKNECKHCENCDLTTNECLLDQSKCYLDGKCLHDDCSKYLEGKGFVPHYNVRKEGILKDE